MSTKVLQRPTASFADETKLVVSPICECVSMQRHPVVSALYAKRQADTWWPESALLGERCGTAHGAITIAPPQGHHAECRAIWSFTSGGQLHYQPEQVPPVRQYA